MPTFRVVFLVFAASRSLRIALEYPTKTRVSRDSSNYGRENARCHARSPRDRRQGGNNGDSPVSGPIESSKRSLDPKIVTIIVPSFLDYAREFVERQWYWENSSLLDSVYSVCLRCHRTRLTSLEKAGRCVRSGPIWLRREFSLWWKKRDVL